MGYSESIENLKSALALFSEDEKRLAELYKNAITNAESEFKTSNERLESQYLKDRNEVYSDTMREERNMFNMLAKRGLGFSGEAAQTKLNSSIILANRLGELASQKNVSALKLEQDLANRKNEISLENAAKQGELFDKKNKLRAEIAALELEKEQNDARLKAEMERFNRQMAAEQAKYEKELAAKYFSTIYGGGSGEIKDGYVPDISEKELAKLLISNASDGGNYKNTKKQFYTVSKYLLDLNDNYDLNSNYYRNLLLILKSYGYTQVSESKMRSQVVAYEADNYFDSQYDKFYDKYIVNGSNVADARNSAKSSALRSELEFIAKRSRSEDEFRRFCREADIGNEAVNDFIKNSSNFKSGSASNGSSNFYGGLN